VEGEKDVESLQALGVVATTNPGGAGKWRTEFNEHLRGRRAIILPDNDAAGRRHAEAVAGSLHGVAASVKVVDLPGLVEHGDVSDWLHAGGTRDDLLSLSEGTPEWQPTPEGPRPAAESEEAKRRESQATELTDLALGTGMDLFHSPDRQPFATVSLGQFNATMSMRSHDFALLLRRLFYEHTGTGIGSQALADAVGNLEAKAIFDGTEHLVFVRVAQSPDGLIYLDLANEAWEAVEISPTGWRVISNPPVKFRRAPGMLALPHPALGGSLSALGPFVNVPDETAWRLAVAWLVAAARPRGPYPILVLQGEQGSAKSTLARVLRAVVDPNTAALRSEPREVRDLMIAATNGWVIALDNLSHLSVGLSDALCRLATGGGFATRVLYTDAEEVLFDAMRPTILNGIEEFATRGDLADRALILQLPSIPDEGRRPEDQFWQDFAAALPAILGGLLDAVSAALRNRPGVRLPRVQRMADFAYWVVAAEPALGWRPGSFLAAYDRNRTAATENTLDASPIASYVRELAALGWEGTAAELLAELTSRGGEESRRQKGWPAGAQSLSNALRRLAPSLRAVGVDVSFRREPGGVRRRLVTLSALGRNAVPLVPLVPLASGAEPAPSLLSPFSSRPGRPPSPPRDAWAGRDDLEAPHLAPAASQHVEDPGLAQAEPDAPGESSLEDIDL